MAKKLLIQEEYGVIDILDIIGRDNELFSLDLENNDAKLAEIISNSSFLVLGGAGTIGKAVSKEIFKRNPQQLDIVDISENNLAELVRDIRSSLGYIRGDFRTFALDIDSIEYDFFKEKNNSYDYVLNLSALKHVRSEKDIFTLMRMINVNIFNTNKTIADAVKFKSKKYFCVSTDKAANPVNMMGASKRIMEMFLIQKSKEIDISTARFANVAFSDGSLLHSFNQRLLLNQPIVAPDDIERYFVTPQESGELCLISAILGNNRDILFPKLSKQLKLTKFSDIAIKFLHARGYEPKICSNEDEAREKVTEFSKQKKWPCLFTKSTTSGEKSFEEFFTDNENIDLDSFETIGIVKNNLHFDEDKLMNFEIQIREMKKSKKWDKNRLLDLFKELIPNFNHLETGNYLDDKM